MANTTDTTIKVINGLLALVATAAVSAPMQRRAKEIIEAKQAEGRDDFTPEEWAEIEGWADARRDDFNTDDEA